MTKNIGELFLNEVVEKLNEIFPEPTAKEESNTTGRTWKGEDCCAQKEEDGVEILNPVAEAQRVLAKAEAAADGVSEPEVKAAALLEVARAHSQVGAQLLSDFDF